MEIPQYHGWTGEPKQGDIREGQLTEREREVVQLLVEGLPHNDIAIKLDISHSTVETHRTSIMRKLRLKKASDLVRYAVRNYIVPG